MFRFRLQRVLELRELSEQAKARELSNARDAAETARAKQKTLSHLRASSRAEIDSAQSETFHVGHLQQSGFVLHSLEERLLCATDDVDAADGLVKAAESALSDAARARQVLDRLKNRHEGVWRAEESQKDRLQMDELALSRHAKRAETASNDEMRENEMSKPSSKGKSQ